MSLPKPKHCDQDWLRMEPSEKGRICEKCARELIDFRKMSWAKIRELQYSSNNSTCGIYSKKQINNWNPESKASNKFTIAAASVLFGMSQLVVSNSLAQTSDTTMNINHSKIDPITNSPAQHTATIRGRIIDRETAEPIPYAQLIIVGTRNAAMSDINGVFQIRIPFGFGREIDIEASYLGYNNSRIEGIKIQPNKITIIDIEMSLLTQLSYFEVKAPSKREERKNKRTARKVKRKSRQ